MTRKAETPKNGRRVRFARFPKQRKGSAADLETDQESARSALRFARSSKQRKGSAADLEPDQESARSALRFARFPKKLAGVVRQHLQSGEVVEIDGLGVFRPAKDGFVFEAEARPRIFLAYVEEDLPLVRKLYRRLEAEGYRPWLDKEKLLPGQNWPRSIERSIEVSDFFIACFSSKAETKRGHFHCELRYALDCAQRLPLEEVYLIPVRLNQCAVPRRITAHFQYVDLFPDWESGVLRILRTIEKQMQKPMRDSLRPAG